MCRLIFIPAFTFYLVTLSAQAGNPLVIVFSAEEIKAIDEVYKAKLSSGWRVSAQPLYNATVDALTNFKNLWNGKPPIVFFVGESLNGGYGIEVAKIFADNGYKVTLAVIPRYKSELLKAEALDSAWEANLQDVVKKYSKNITVNDFRADEDSVAATKAIDDYRKQLMEDHKEILQNEQIAVEDQITTIQKLKETDDAEILKKNLKRKLENERVKVVTSFLHSLSLSSCVAIDAIDAAGYESEGEIVQKYVIRYALAQAVSEHLNERQNPFGVVTGSYGPLSNTTAERGYYHVTKDGNRTVTLIPHSHIPDFMVHITYPGESVVALEDDADYSTGYKGTVAYQYKRTLMYVTVYVDPKENPKVPMAACIEEVTNKRTRKNNDSKQDLLDARTLAEFIKELRNAEVEYKNNKYVSGGFLHVTLPDPVSTSVAYLPGIAELEESTEMVKSASLKTLTKVKTVTKYLSFANYVSMFTGKGNRRNR